MRNMWNDFRDGVFNMLLSLMIVCIKAIQGLFNSEDSDQKTA